MRRILLGILFICLLLPALAAAQDFPPQVQKALDDLNQRLGLELTLKDFNWRYSKNVYPNSSLGCPQPGIAYTQGNTPGYQVQLDVHGLTWDYRVSNDLSRVTLCSPLATPTPTPLPTFPPPIFQPNVAVPGSTATPTFCPNAPAPRLINGLMAQVQPGVPNIVRQAPGESSGLLGQLPANEVVYVLDGPRCASDMAWWYVADTRSRLVGWTAEGIANPQAQTSNEYWLSPIIPPDYATPTPASALPELPLSTNTPNVPPTATIILPTFTPSLTPTATLAPVFPTVAAAVCNASVPPRLIINGHGRVTPGIPNNIREGAGTSTKYVGEIPPGGVFTILEGPTCASGMSWWKVNYNGLTGWTPEGQAGDYWVEPAI
ncbi:MAG: SH3 domain-containing protein [Anaerolineae bacterium]|nr:SH3 domain-containing protein [Anaerolineae bacterium]